MFLLQLAVTLGLLAVCSFAPGFFFVRRLRWSPLEKLCGAAGLSLLLLFLAGWLIDLLTAGIGTERIPSLVVSGVCLALGAICWRDIRRLFRGPRVRQVLGGYAVLLLWTGLLLGMIRSYSGGAWFGDWLEHFQRSLFFLHHFPAPTVLLGQYRLPARPPMMNVLAAFFLAQTEDRFEIFQVVFAFLNLLVFLPCCLLVPALSGKRRYRMAPLLCLFALSPVVMQNATYTWTKLFTAFYVVLGISLYLAGWRKQDRLRLVAGFVSICAGVLVHYSAAPYLLVLGAHYLFFVFPRRRAKWSELATIGAIGAALFSVWLGWSIRTYGVVPTFASNSTVTLSQQYGGNFAAKVAFNLVDTLVPAILRDPSAMQSLNQPNTAGTVRDYAFVLYQPNLIFGMGIAGGPLILALLYAGFERRKACKAEGKFWLFFVPWCVFAGILVVGERDPLGDAHLTLLPLELIGLAALCAALPLRRTLAALLIAGCIVDFSLGIFLQARVENMENTPGHEVYSGLRVTGGEYSVGGMGPHSLSVNAGRNWFRKHQYQLCTLWLAELAPHVAADRSARQLADDLAAERDEDRTAWQGWYSRHGGSVEFLGDRVAAAPFGPSFDLVLLLIVFCGFVTRLWGLARMPVSRASNHPTSGAAGAV